MSDRSGGSFRSWVTQDWEVNSDRLDSQLIVAWFRLCQWGLSHWGRFGSVMTAVFNATTATFLHLEMSPRISVGPNLWLPHPHSISINYNAKIGANCMLRHRVTIGNTTGLDKVETPSPVVGDNVEIAVGAVVAGDIKIGDHARIGANAVVTSDVPPGALAFGNPARVLQAERS